VAAGKGDYFAVRGRRAALPSDDLDQEQALLVDPSMPGFDAKKHFEFLPDGTIKPLTDEARHSCELLGLNLRELLVSERELSYLQAKQAFASMFAQLLSDAPASSLVRVRKQINEMWQGQSAYSAFARQALETVVANLQQKTGTHFQLPLP
jgi:hypothetical protein